MLHAYQSLFGATVASMVRVGEAWNEIAALSPQVVALRTDAALASLGSFSAVGDGEQLRMVAEKIDALAEGAVAATLESSLAFGRSLSGLGGPLDAAADIVVAAVAPMRERLRANVERLGGATQSEMPVAAQ